MSQGKRKQVPCVLGQAWETYHNATGPTHRLAGRAESGIVDRHLKPPQPGTHPNRPAVQQVRSGTCDPCQQATTLPQPASCAPQVRDRAWGPIRAGMGMLLAWRDRGGGP